MSMTSILPGRPWSTVFACIFVTAFCWIAGPLATAQSGQDFARLVMGGDLLRITVDESPDLDGVYTVAGDGSIDFNFVGRVRVEGKSVDEVAAAIKSMLESTYFKKATVGAEVSEYYSGSIMILGAVNSPGSVPYRGNEIITLLEAIIGAGGMTERAASDQVKIFRWRSGGSMERDVINVDIKRIMTEYDFARDQYLRPRDIVVVPELGQDGGVSEFLALGEFGRTGFYPVTGDMNMIRAVSLAGGVTKEAYLEGGRVLRPGSDGNYSVIPVDFSRLFGAADMRMNVSIFPGDILFVPSATQGSAGKVYFLGEVDRPGAYPLAVGGSATLARTILQAGGLGKFANTSSIRIQRKSPDGSTQTLVFDAERILKTGNFDKDLPLQDEDVIMVPGRIFSF
jgi:polysaccharide export outer membrane protein